MRRKSDHLHPFLTGGGEAAKIIAGFDWAATSLGPISGWPGSRKSAISFILRSTVPIVTLWGDDGIMIYNDGYAEFAGGRHPALFGSKVREGWPEVADFNDNIMKVVHGAGGTIAYREQMLTLSRNGVPEEVWLDLDYSPLLDEDGKPAAVMAIVIETTAKVRAERERDAEREAMRRMFEQAPGFMAMMSGRQHIFTMVNEAYRTLVGHRDVLGKPVREALPEVVDQGFTTLLDEVFESGKPFIGLGSKVELIRGPEAGGEERYLDFIYQPIADDKGVTTGIFVQGHDVTEHKRIESALRESEAQFRTFAEAMANHVWTAPPSGMLDWFNTRVYEYSGASTGELDGIDWATIVHPEDLPDAAEKWAKSVASGEPYEMDFRLRRTDGVYRWHVARAILIRDEDGNPFRWIGTNTDIDDQKNIQQQFLDSERRLRLSQEAAGIASMEVDIASGQVVGTSKFWDLFGLEQRESAPTSLLEAIVLNEDAEIRSSPATRQAGTALSNVEYRIRRPDNGEIRWLSRNMEFQYDAGKPVKMFGAIRDITEQKEAQARQILLTHELEHRIKNILATVSAIASQTLRGGDMESARTALTERLRALADAHDILTKTQWTSASLSSVLASAIAPFPGDRIAADGPPVQLGPKRALSLALAVNELSTNSIKYGALSVPEGKVEIAWSRAPGDDGMSSLVWTWRESGGPPVEQPQRRGFGRFLIERVLAADFGGTVTIEYRPEGVECVLTAPWPTAKRPD